jgi:uncharacterized protein (TIGR00295 family)
LGWIPNEQEALELHAKEGSSERVVNHCKLVARAAKIIAEDLNQTQTRVDVRAVYSGALLHDIGRSKTNSIHHGVVGAMIVRKYGVDESVAEIIQRHVGAGISKEEAAKYGFPKGGDYEPSTLEQRIMCFSDKIIEEDGVAPFQREVEKFRKKGLDVGKLLALKQSIRDALGKDPEVLVAEKFAKRTLG